MTDDQVPFTKATVVAQSSWRYTAYEVDDGLWLVSIPYNPRSWVDASMIFALTEDERSLAEADIAWLHAYSAVRRNHFADHRQHSLAPGIHFAVHELSKQGPARIPDNRQLRIWQLEWHEALDRHQREPESAEKTDLDLDIGCDFRMHFDTWQLTDQQLVNCFSVVPGGSDVARRAITLRGNELPSITAPEQATELLRSGLKAMSAFVDLSVDPDGPVRVFSSDVLDAAEAFADADFASFDLDEEGAAFADPARGPLVSRFLSETLYRYGNDFALRSWMLWALCDDPKGIDPYHSFAVLSLHGYLAGVDETGLFLSAS